jgi:methionyl-tRNA synthetase
MPETAEKILATLGCDSADTSLTDQSRWGVLKPGTQIAKAKPLFPRIEND